MLNGISHIVGFLENTLILDQSSIHHVCCIYLSWNLVFFQMLYKTIQITKWSFNNVLIQTSWYLLRLLLTSHSSLLLRQMRQMRPSVRPHGISLPVFPRLLAWSTYMGYGCLLDFAALSQLIRHVRLVSDFCPSSYDFAIPSSRLYLTI